MAHLRTLPGLTPLPPLHTWGRRAENPEWVSEWYALAGITVTYLINRFGLPKVLTYIRLTCIDGDVFVGSSSSASARCAGVASGAMCRDASAG